MSNFGYTLTGKGVTLFFGAKPVPIDNTHPNYDAIVAELKSGANDVDKLKELADLPKAISGLLFGDVVVGDDGIIYYLGKPVHNYLADKIVVMLREGWDISIWAKFLNNLMKNPSEVAIKELYLFLEKAQMPLTPDGHFLAFKKVRANYTSIHDSKTDNSIGSKPSMPRETVNPDRHQTCSAGLHFCAHDYLTHFGSSGSTDRVVIVKINPADVVAIPSDYANAKGRAWTYEVVGEIENPGSGPRDKSFDKTVDDRWDTPDTNSSETNKEDQELLFGDIYTAEEVLAKVAEVGSVRGAARALGIAKSTFGDWVKKAKEQKRRDAIL